MPIHNIGLSALAPTVKARIPAAVNDPATSQLSDLDEFGAEQVASSNVTFGGVSDAILNNSLQTDREEQADFARTQSNRISDNFRARLLRRQRALGLNLSDRQQRAQTRRLSLTRAINQANAVTEANRTTTDIAEKANQAGAFLQDSLEGLQNFGLSQLANAEGIRNRREARERARKRASRNSLIGSIGGASAALIALSSEAVKDKIEESPKGLLDKIANIRVDRWRYKEDDAEHLGPYAEEFNSTFGVGQKHPRMINLVDAVGVTMAALKELNEKVEAHAT